MKATKDDFYSKLNAYATEYAMQIGCKQSNQDFIYYPMDDENTYAPIGEIRLETFEVNGKTAAERFYYLLPSIEKKPKKVKI